MRCYHRTRDRLQTILKHAEAERQSRGVPVVRDLVEEACGAHFAHVSA